MNSQLECAIQEAMAELDRSVTSVTASSSTSTTSSNRTHKARILKPTSTQQRTKPVKIAPKTKWPHQLRYIQNDIYFSSTTKVMPIGGFNFGWFVFLKRKLEKLSIYFNCEYNARRLIHPASNKLFFFKANQLPNDFEHIENFGYYVEL